MGAKQHMTSKLMLKMLTQEVEVRTRRSCIEDGMKAMPDFATGGCLCLPMCCLLKWPCQARIGFIFTNYNVFGLLVPIRQLRHHLSHVLPCCCAAAAQVCPVNKLSAQHVRLQQREW